MSVAFEHLIREAVVRLDAAGIPSPEAEAQHLAALALGISGNQVNSRADIGQVAAEFVEFVRQRSRRVPLQRLAGRVAFRNIELFIGDDVFMPQPETASLVQWCV